MYVHNQHPTIIKHKDLLLYVISTEGPATTARIFEKTQNLLIAIGPKVFPLNFTQFRRQLQFLIRTGLVTHNGNAIQATRNGFRTNLKMDNNSLIS